MFRRRGGWVYALQRGQQIKIGMTEGATPERRIRQLQTGQPDEMTLRAAWGTPNPRRLEERMHQILAPHHHRGEWFTITVDQAVAAYRQASGRSSLALRGHLLRSEFRLGLRQARRLAGRVCGVVGAAVLGLGVTWLVVLVALDLV